MAQLTLPIPTVIRCDLYDVKITNKCVVCNLLFHGVDVNLTEM